MRLRKAPSKKKQRRLRKAQSKRAQRRLTKAQSKKKKQKKKQRTQKDMRQKAQSKKKQSPACGRTEPIRALRRNISMEQFLGLPSPFATDRFRCLSFDKYTVYYSGVRGPCSVASWNRFADCRRAPD